MFELGLVFCLANPFNASWLSHQDYGHRLVPVLLWLFFFNFKKFGLVKDWPDLSLYRTKFWQRFSSSREACRLGLVSAFSICWLVSILRVSYESLGWDSSLPHMCDSTCFVIKTLILFSCICWLRLCRAQFAQEVCTSNFKLRLVSV